MFGENKDKLVSLVVEKSTIGGDFTIEGRITGEGTGRYLLGFIPMGNTHEVQGVWGGGSSLFSKDHAKMHATYDALTTSGADFIVEPRYEVVTTKASFLWTTVTAKVHGFKGVINSYNQLD